MIVVIFAGGRGNRMAEVTQGKLPKPMVTIGGIPMLEHIINLYEAQAVGQNHYVVAAGRGMDVIGEWAEAHPMVERICVYQTGEDTQTGGRLKRLQSMIPMGPFAVTYGDGLTDLNFSALMDFHKRQHEKYGVAVTLTAVRPPNRFGYMTIKDGLAVDFAEKPNDIGSWVNGGFYIIERGEIMDLIPNDNCVFELDVLPTLALQGRLAAFAHSGWWQCMDHPREHDMLEELWAKGQAPWTRWAKG